MILTSTRAQRYSDLNISTPIWGHLTIKSFDGLPTNIVGKHTL